MLVLGIETSHEPGSIALTRDGVCLEECDLSGGKRRGQSLVLEIQELYRRHGISIRETDLIGVGIGPGSFTGLRVGIVAAKGIAYACGIPVGGIPTLRAIVENVPAEIFSATVAVDAQRDELFLQSFIRETEGWKAISEIEIKAFESWRNELRREETILGPGLLKHRERLDGICRVLDEATGIPRGIAVGSLAVREEFRQTAWEILPLYVRKSAAEETWDKKVEASKEGLTTPNLK